MAHCKKHDWEYSGWCLKCAEEDNPPPPDLGAMCETHHKPMAFCEVCVDIIERGVKADERARIPDLGAMLVRLRQSLDPNKWNPLYVSGYNAALAAAEAALADGEGEG